MMKTPLIGFVTVLIAFFAAGCDTVSYDNSFGRLSDKGVMRWGSDPKQIVAWELGGYVTDSQGVAKGEGEFAFRYSSEGQNFAVISKSSDAASNPGFCADYNGSDISYCVTRKDITPVKADTIKINSATLTFGGVTVNGQMKLIYAPKYDGAKGDEMPIYMVLMGFGAGSSDSLSPTVIAKIFYEFNFDEPYSGSPGNPLSTEDDYIFR